MEQPPAAKKKNEAAKSETMIFVQHGGLYTENGESENAPMQQLMNAVLTMPIRSMLSKHYPNSVRNWRKLR